MATPRKAPQDRKSPVKTKKAVGPFDLSTDTGEVFPVKIGEDIWELPAFSSVTIDQLDLLDGTESIDELKEFYNELLPGFGDALGGGSAARLGDLAEAWKAASDAEGK